MVSIAKLVGYDVIQTVLVCHLNNVIMIFSVVKTQGDIIFLTGHVDPHTYLKARPTVPVR